MNGPAWPRNIGERRVPVNLSARELRILTDALETVNALRPLSKPEDNLLERLSVVEKTAWELEPV